ncbi:MAG TPA: rhodanese-like domain-containing protein [Gammaproteobacteria bacterium]|nr:rhodanese-like domain-containing protein [Gammaproteobacteria bacterium]
MRQGEHHPETQNDAQSLAGTSNISMGSEYELKQRFAKDKEIIVYDDSLECGASTHAARELVRRGFHRVKDYEEGIHEQRERDNVVHGTGVRRS